MHARITSVEIQPGKLDETISIIQESIVPVMKQQAGFTGWFLLTDAEKNKISSITLWETLSDLIEGGLDPSYQDQIAKLIDLASGPPSMEYYEVKAQVGSFALAQNEA